MWKHHWGLRVDPFARGGGAYVRTAGHDEAVARLADSIETGERLAVLRAGEGLGKSTVLGRVIAETRGPNRRFSRVTGPVDGPGMLAGLAAGLGRAVPTLASRSASWQALAEAVRLCRWQKTHAVLVVEDCQNLRDPADLLDLRRITHLAPNPSGLLTVIHSFREPDVNDANAAAEVSPAWQLVIGLPPLTLSETRRYVDEKLYAAGRDETAFTPRAVARLHDFSGGVPRGIDRLGSLSLMAAAVRGMELVTPVVVDGAARECTLPGSGFAA